METTRLYFSVLFFSIFFLQSNSYAASAFARKAFTQDESMDTSLHVGIGFTDFEAKSPVSAVSLSNGTSVFIAGEQEINELGSSIVVSLTYLSTEGLASYDYGDSGGTSYVGSDIGFEMQNYLLGVGLKQRFLREGWLSPYLEVGGFVGYHTIEYSSNLSSILSIGAGDPNGFKRDESVMGFGYFGEAGFELGFSESFGGRIGGRYQYTQTENFETIGNQKLNFQAVTFHLGLFLRF